MKDRVQSQIDLESTDGFKKQVVFPAVARELKETGRGGGIRVLHIGEGSGQISEFVADCGIVEAVLVDKESRILKVASDNFDLRGIPNRTILQDATHLLPIKPGSMDVAVALFSLNQIKYPEVVFDLVSSYLRPGGRFIVCVPDEAFINRLAEVDNKLDTKILGVLDRVQTGFLFRRQGLKVDFYARPNSDYLEYMNASGFIGIESYRLEDKQDGGLVKTPKAFLMVGRKMPVRMGDDKDNEVVIASDQVFGALPVALEAKEGFDYLKLNLQVEGGLRSIPLPKSEKAKQILRLIFRDKTPNIIVREIRMKSSEGTTKYTYRIFQGGKLIAYYSISATKL